MKTTLSERIEKAAEPLTGAADLAIDLCGERLERAIGVIYLPQMSAPATTSWPGCPTNLTLSCISTTRGPSNRWNAR